MSDLKIILKSVFNFEDFKNVYQKEAIEAILKNDQKNFIINMQTQGGKSLCYQLPGKIIELKISSSRSNSKTRFKMASYFCNQYDKW